MFHLLTVREENRDLIADRVEELDDANAPFGQFHHSPSLLHLALDLLVQELLLWLFRDL